MKINAAITLLFSEDGFRLELHDRDAGEQFVRIHLNNKQTCQVLSRLACTECESAEVFNLECVGKKLEHKPFEFRMPDNISYKDRKEIAIAEAQKQCPEGWVPDTYFGSKDSFVIRNKEQWAKTTIRRWV